MIADKEFKQKWINALRSGEYPQSHGTLRDKDGFCCLGVGCAVAGMEVLIKPIRPPSKAEADVVEKWKAEYQKWMKIDEANYLWIASQGVPNCDLWVMNDERRMSFPEIADWIEANL